MAKPTTLIDGAGDNETAAEKRARRMAELKAEREARMEEEAKQRAASDPMKDPTNRPEAPQLDDGYIRYYSWIGGVTTGSWRLYKEKEDSPKAASAEARSEGGATQANFSSSVGANALKTNPSTTTPSTTTPSTTTPSTTTPSTTTPSTTTPSTTTPSTTSPSTSTPSTTAPTVITTTDPATLALIKSLQDQIAALTSTIGKQDAAAAQAKADAAAAEAAAKKEKTESAIAVLTDRFSRYGLASLVPKIKELAIGGASESTITLQLQETEEYRQRFRANQDRIKKGLSVLDPGDYLALEDDYRQILRAYGLKQFDNDDYVTQFISNDISTTELSNRVVTAVQRVQNADPAVLATLRGFYGISDNDLVAYVLDPNQQFQKIERQVAAAEIGSAAKLQGINAGVAVSEQLAAQGVTKAQAQKGYATIADILPTAEKLSDIYAGTLDEYRLGEAEQEVFNTLASAQRKRQKLVEREVAAFSGSSGLSKSSLTSQIGGNI
jgi:hypothetical protein